MKTTLLSTLACLVMGTAYSQSNYTISTLGSSYTSEQIDLALGSADLCGYYYQNDARVLTFNDGSIVELSKASELTGVAANCITYQHANHTTEVWEISASGHLIKRIATNPTK